MSDMMRNSGMGSGMNCGPMGMMGSMNCGPMMGSESMSCNPMNWGSMNGPMSCGPMSCGPQGCDPKMMKKMMCNMMKNCGSSSGMECGPMGMMGCNPSKMNKCGRSEKNCDMSMGNMDCNPMMMKCMMAQMGCDPTMMGQCNPQMMGQCDPKKMMKYWKMMNGNMSCDKEDRSSSMDGKCDKANRCPIPKCARRAFIMAEKFGGEPEQYRQFVEETKDKKFEEMMCLWKKSHKESEDMCTKRNAARMAYLFRQSTDKMMEFIKANPNMGFRDLLRKCCQEKGMKVECHDHDDDEHSEHCSDSDTENRKDMRSKREKGNMKDMRNRRDEDNSWSKWDEQSESMMKKTQESKPTPMETPNTPKTTTPTDNAKQA